MINPEEVISHFKDLKERAAKITDPDEKRRVVTRGLNKWTLEEWCEVGNILIRANLL